MQVWLASPGFQLVRAKADDYAALVELGNQRLRVRGGAICTVIDAALSNRWMWLPIPRYDTAWAQIHRLREVLCEHAALSTVLAVVLPDIRGDLSYVDPPTEQQATRAEVATAEAALQALIITPNPVTESVVRTNVQAISRAVSDARQSMWLKVNMRRSRLALMGILLGLILIAALIALPAVVEDRSHPFFISLALSAAAGGLISALFSPEPLGAKAHVFYISRRLLYLRPLIGAFVGLVSFFAVQAGLLSVVGIGKDSQPVGFLVLAFASGFSERAIINRVVQPLIAHTSKVVPAAGAAVETDQLTVIPGGG